MRAIRSMPCTSCPYRRDVPSGVWVFEEYEKLRAYDNYTNLQPIAAFHCHASPEAYCHGWAVCHQNRGADPGDPLSRHPFDLLALRLAGSLGRWDGIMPETSVPLFGSGNDAADHGQLDSDNPSPESRRTAQRLLRKYPRLETG